MSQKRRTIKFKNKECVVATSEDIGKKCVFVDYANSQSDYVCRTLHSIDKSRYPFTDDQMVGWRYALLIPSQETKVAPEVSPSSESILDEAKRITHGDRQATYGPPDQDFARTAGMINSLFKDYLKDGCEFKPKDVASIMILIKLSRNRHQNKRDNSVDIAGYAHCLQVCMDCEKKTVDDLSTGKGSGDE